jgi:hypothetical protein
VARNGGAGAAASRDSSGRQGDILLLASLVGGVVLLALGVATAGRRYAAGHRRSRARPGTEPWAYISAVFVGSRWLPILDEDDPGKRRALRKGIVPIVGACAIVLVIAYFVMRHVG